MHAIIVKKRPRRVGRGLSGRAWRKGKEKYYKFNGGICSDAHAAWLSATEALVVNAHRLITQH